jgi:hypothetical protein
MGANRPPSDSEGVECRLGSSIIKTASPKRGPQTSLRNPRPTAPGTPIPVRGRIGKRGIPPSPNFPPKSGIGEIASGDFGVWGL